MADVTVKHLKLVPGENGVIVAIGCVPGTFEATV